MKMRFFILYFLLFITYSFASITISSPASIQTAISNVITQGTDYTIYLNAGTYNQEQISVNSASPITIIGLGNSTNPVIIGQAQQDGKDVFDIVGNTSFSISGFKKKKKENVSFSFF